MNPTEEQIRAVNLALRPVLDALEAKLATQSEGFEKERVLREAAGEMNLAAECASSGEVIDRRLH